MTSLYRFVYFVYWLQDNDIPESRAPAASASLSPVRRIHPGLVVSLFLTLMMATPQLAAFKSPAVDNEPLVSVIAPKL